MTEPRHGWTDDRVDQVIGNLLRAGVTAAALLVLAGAVLYLLDQGRHPVPDRSRFHGEPPELRGPALIVDRAVRRDDLALIQAGLLLLIATPVARVLFSVLAFAAQRDLVYVLVTLLVLGVLLYSLFSGHLG